jgi:integrase
VTFDECADAYITAHEPSWRNARHRQQWRATLADHVRPLLGKLAVADIDRGLVLRVLEPIWHSLPETAGRVRGRLERILDFGEARGYRPEGSNPARLVPIKTALGRRPKEVRHFTALPYGELPGFLTELRKRQGVPFRALEFLILCAARTGEVLGATWSEVDLAERTWIVPRERMKANKEHRVPLTDAAVDLLRALPRELGNNFVFVGSRGAGLGHGALLLALRSVRRDVTAHGMRSTFRTWAAECTRFPREVIEASLAHLVGDATERAYQRGDLFEKRRRLMAAWTAYCAKAAAAGEVVPLRALAPSKA